MKTHIICMLLLFASFGAFAQQAPPSAPSESQKVQEMQETPPAETALPATESRESLYETFDLEVKPEFPGGEAALLQFLGANIQYPDSAVANNVQGLAIVQFVVNKDGSISDCNILRNPGYGCGEEACRVVMRMPRWSVGMVNGYPVRVRYTLPVRFRLD